MPSLRLTMVMSVVALMLGGCDLFGGSAEVRYRITVEIDTPSGVRASSGVWAFKLTPGNIDQAYNGRFRGEAIPIQLPHGTVYALLDLRAAEGTEDVPRVSSQAMLPERIYYSRYLEPAN